MVNKRTIELDAVFHALADATRRAMLEALSEGERPVSQLAAPFDMSLPAASKHIKVLENAGLLLRRVEGRKHYCALNAGPMHGGYEWIRHYQRFWDQRLDRLEALLRAEDEAKVSNESQPSKTTGRESNE